MKAGFFMRNHELVTINFMHQHFVVLENTSNLRTVHSQPLNIIYLSTSPPHLWYPLFLLYFRASINPIFYYTSLQSGMGEYIGLLLLILLLYFVHA